MEPKPTDVVKAVAAGTVEGFMKTVGAALNELGQWGADLVRFQRWKTQIRIFEKAKAFCDEMGVDPQAIPTKILVPLVEYMSLEDDPETSSDPEGAEAMQDRWAALLANAAMGDAGAEVLPGFPHILSELTAPEAEILESLRKHEEESYARSTALDTLIAAAGAEHPTFGRPRDPAYQRVLVQLGNLERLGLCTVRHPNKELGEVVRYLGDDMHLVHLETRSVVELTELGRAFIAACTPPGEAEAEGPEET